MKKNYLVLINYSEKLPYFLKNLSNKICEDNNRCFYAVDSFFTRDIHFKESDSKYEIFEKNFDSCGVCDEKVLEKYKDFPLNQALLSDIERAEVYKFGKNRSNEYYLNLQTSLLLFFENIIEKYNIDVVVYENISNSFSYFSYVVAKKHDIPYLGITSSRLPGYFVTDSYINYESKKIQRKFQLNTIISETDNTYITNYLKNLDNIVPDGIKDGGHSNLSLIDRYMKKRKLEIFFFSLKYIFMNNKDNYLLGNPFVLSLNSFKRSLFRKLKSYFIKNMYVNSLPDKNFFLYPLQFHPESSTSVRSPDFLNELEVIKNISFNLPVNTFLFVKDHPSSYGYPSLDFYNAVSKLPNVCLLNPFINTKELIKSCSGVITLTSTVGYEALLLNKNVLLFGNVFYEFHKNVKKFNGYDNITKILNDFLNNSTHDDYEYNVRFVAAYMKTSYQGFLNFDNNSIDFDEFCSKSYNALKDSLIDFEYD